MRVSNTQVWKELNYTRMNKKDHTMSVSITMDRDVTMCPTL